MNLDRSHLKWIVAVLVLAALGTVVYVACPGCPSGSSPLGLFFGLCGTGMMAFAGLLPFKKRLAKWKILRPQTLQRGHIWLGLLSVPLVLFHCGFRRGGSLSAALLVLLTAIMVSGIAGLLFQHLLPLCKEGKTGKGRTAAVVISSVHRLTLLLHIPLAVALFVLVVFHAIMSLYF
jgi:hypothetical protein